jgi:hypothetical protein
MPNLTIQVRSDAGTKNPEAAQKTFDLLGTEEKETIWGENTTHRWRKPASRARYVANSAPAARRRRLLVSDPS